MNKILKKIDEEIEFMSQYSDQNQFICGLEKAKEIILSQQKETCEYILEDDDMNTWECSKCGDIWILEVGTPKDNNMNYCPNCGKELVK